MTHVMIYVVNGRSS